MCHWCGEAPQRPLYHYHQSRGSLKCWSSDTLSGSQSKNIAKVILPQSLPLHCAAVVVFVVVVVVVEVLVVVVVVVDVVVVVVVVVEVVVVVVVVVVATQ